MKAMKLMFSFAQKVELGIHRIKNYSHSLLSILYPTFIANIKCMRYKSLFFGLLEFHILWYLNASFIIIVLI